MSEMRTAVECLREQDDECYLVFSTDQDEIRLTLPDAKISGAGNYISVGLSEGTVLGVRIVPYLGHWETIVLARGACKFSWAFEGEAAKRSGKVYLDGPPIQWVMVGSDFDHTHAGRQTARAKPGPQGFLPAGS
jgi:hypothetical protein